MTELILATFSPSLKLNLKYMDIIKTKEDDESYTNSYKENKSHKEINSQIEIKQLNKTYPQYKKNNYQNVVKHKLSRSFSFDLIY